MIVEKKLKKNKELWIKIKDLIRSITKNSDNSDDELPRNKTIEVLTMTIVVSAVVH